MENPSYNSGNTNTSYKKHYVPEKKNQGEEIKLFMHLTDKEREENTSRPNRIKSDLSKFLG